MICIERSARAALIAIMLFQLTIPLALVAAALWLGGIAKLMLLVAALLSIGAFVLPFPAPRPVTRLADKTVAWPEPPYVESAKLNEVLHGFEELRPEQWVAIARAEAPRTMLQAFIHGFRTLRFARIIEMSWSTEASEVYAAACFKIREMIADGQIPNWESAQAALLIMAVRLSHPSLSHHERDFVLRPFHVAGVQNISLGD